MIPGIIKAVCWVVLLAPLINVSAQVAAVRFTVHVPDAGANDKGVYIAGSFNYWHAGDSLYRMNKTGEGIYAITLPLFEGKQYKYKYTQGNWDRVELALNDSDISNRLFISADGKNITDTVVRWKQPKPAETKSNPQLQKITAMKDSTLAKLQPEINNMLQLLRSYIENMLQEKPSARVHKRLDKKAVGKIRDAYKEITMLLWNVMASLSPEQKQSILASINKPAAKDDFLNTFTGALNTVVEDKKPSR